MKRTYLLVLLGLLVFSLGFISGDHDDSDYHIVGNSRVTFVKFYQNALEKGYFSYPELSKEVLPQLLGKSYGTGGRGCPGDKTLVNFHSFDCVTLVESYWGLSRTIYEYQSGQTEDPDPFRVFARNLDQVRYFGGENCGIDDRMHYFTQGMQEMERAGMVFNVAIANGKPFTKKINYLSQRLEEQGDRSSVYYKKMKEREKILSESENWFYPNKIRENYFPLAESGDIIAFASTEKGLDVCHTGIIVIEDGLPMLIHASSLHDKVVKQSLISYLNYRTKITGFFVYRPIF